MIMAERSLIPTHDLSVGSSSSNFTAAARVSEQPQPPIPAAPLRCPRCDSTNTKFCYYNNYSLSQPRHFCKACKRYWTRGGTLRNVPVGGGCRKNKRVKKPASISSAPPALAPSPPPLPLLSPSHFGVPDLTQLLYGLDVPALRQTIELPSSCAAVSIPPVANEHQPQLAAHGIGFSCGTNETDEACYHLAQLQQQRLLHDYSFLVSSLKQQPKNKADSCFPYSAEMANGNLGGIKGVKLENEPGAMSHRLDWQLPCDINPFENMAAAAVPGDASLLYWNAAVGAWPDATTNCGSSLAPLI